MNSNEYMRKYLNRRYRERRALAYQLLGGKCVRCGEADKLEIDHVDPSNRLIETGDFRAVSLGRFMEEIAKCQLLCGPCHDEKTIRDKGLRQARGTHGTLSAYRYCRCNECKSAKSKHDKSYREKKKLLGAASGVVARL